MAAQRCVWSCLANSPGASSPEYNACVAQYCSAGPDWEDEPPLEPWTQGIAADGRTQFAGWAFRDNSGRGIYYMCNREGESYMVLYGLAGPPGTYQMRVDGVNTPLYFDRSRVELTSKLHRTHGLIGSMANGTALQVFGPGGQFVAQVPLHNAQRALGDAIGSCQM